MNKRRVFQIKKRTSFVCNIKLWSEKLMFTNRFIYLIFISFFLSYWNEVRFCHFFWDFWAFNSIYTLKKLFFYLWYHFLINFLKTFPIVFYSHSDTLFWIRAFCDVITYDSLEQQSFLWGFGLYLIVSSFTLFESSGKNFYTLRFRWGVTKSSFFFEQIILVYYWTCMLNDHMGCFNLYRSFDTNMMQV